MKQNLCPSPACLNCGTFASATMFPSLVGPVHVLCKIRKEKSGFFCEHTDRCLKESKSIVLLCSYSGIVGTLITGHILEVSYSWKDVFNLNAVVLVFGAVVFLIFGTAKKVV